MLDAPGVTKPRVVLCLEHTHHDIHMDSALTGLIGQWREIVFQSFSKPNPSTPKSDQHLISPNNITPESNITITRIKEMITN